MNEEQSKSKVLETLESILVAFFMFGGIITLITGAVIKVPPIMIIGMFMWFCLGGMLCISSGKNEMKKRMKAEAESVYSQNAVKKPMVFSIQFAVGIGFFYVGILGILGCFIVLLGTPETVNMLSNYWPFGLINLFTLIGIMHIIGVIQSIRRVKTCITKVVHAIVIDFKVVTSKQSNNMGYALVYKYEFNGDIYEVSDSYASRKIKRRHKIGEEKDIRINPSYPTEIYAGPAGIIIDGIFGFAFFIAGISFNILYILQMLGKLV